MPADLAALREQYPGWRFGSVWASAASGPDARRVWARNGAVLLTAWDAAELRLLIARERACSAAGPKEER